MGLFFKNDNFDECFYDLLQFKKYRDFEEGIIEGKLGELMVCFKYTGIDFESASNDELNIMSARLNDLMRSFGSGWVMWTEALRLETSVYPDADTCHFPDETSRMIDNERRIAVQEQEAHYETVAFIVLLYTPPSKLSRSFAAAMIDDDTGEERLTLEQKTDKQFRKQVAVFEGALQSLFEAIRLRPYQDEDNAYYCPILQLFHYCATGILRQVRVPHPSIEFDILIAGQDFHPSFTPRVGDLFVGTVSIEGMHSFTEPAMLAVFDQLPLKYRWSTRFIFLDRHKAIEKLEASRRKWQQQRTGFKDQLLQSANPKVDLDAERMVVDTDEALAEIRSGDVNEGYYTSVFVLYADSIEALDASTDLFKNTLDNMAFGGRVERVNAVESFLGSIPGNAYTNISRTPINTANLADLLPVASAWPGDQFNQCPFYEPNSPPLIQGETPGSTPFRLNLHVGDVGHTFIAGPTGSGKSTLLALVCAQHLKYRNAQLFGFDKGHSMFPICCGVGGSHFDIGQENKEGELSHQFMPLQEIDKSSDFLWATNWIEQCLVLQGVEVNASHRTLIEEAMKRLRSSPNRSMTEYVANLQDRELSEALNFYTIAGEAGKLLDGETDSANWSNFNIIEVGSLMDTGERIVLPILLYLFKKIERSLNGSPTLIILDECWMMLDHPVFRQMIREWLKTLRKANTSVIMATQSIDDAAKSGIMDVINSSCLTKILLPNQEIYDDQIKKFYIDSLGLNENEIGLLAHATPKRQYYYRSPKGKRIFELNLRPKTLAYVGRSSKTDIAKIRELMDEKPNSWREHWLSYCTGTETPEEPDVTEPQKKEDTDQPQLAETA